MDFGGSVAAAVAAAAAAGDNESVGRGRRAGKDWLIAKLEDADYRGEAAGGLGKDLAGVGARLGAAARQSRSEGSIRPGARSSRQRRAREERVKRTSEGMQPFSSAAGRRVEPAHPLDGAGRRQSSRRVRGLLALPPQTPHRAHGERTRLAVGPAKASTRSPTRHGGLRAALLAPSEWACHQPERASAIRQHGARPAGERGEDGDGCSWRADRWMGAEEVP